MVDGIYKNNSNKNWLRNNNQFTSREGTKELQISVGDEEENELHEDDRKSLPSDSEKYEETSHEYEEVFIENTEDNFETHATLEVKQRASTDGWLNYEGVPTDGWSQIYVGDIDIRVKNVAASQNSIKHENEDLVAVEEETRSTSPSPLELHEVGPRKKMKMRILICKSLIFLKGP